MRKIALALLVSIALGGLTGCHAHVRAYHHGHVHGHGCGHHYWHGSWWGHPHPASCDVCIHVHDGPGRKHGHHR